MAPEGSSPHSQVPATCPILIQLDPAHNPTSHFLKIQLNIILPSTPGSPKWSLSVRFPHQNPVFTSSLPIRAICPAHLILPDFITRTVLGKEYRSWSCSLCSFLHSLLTSSLLGPNILFNTLFSNTISLRSSLKVSDQVSHPYETTGKIKVVREFCWQVSATCTSCCYRRRLWKADCNSSNSCKVSTRSWGSQTVRPRWDCVSGAGLILCSR